MAERCIRTTERERLSSTACARRLYTATPPLLCYVVERENPKAATRKRPNGANTTNIDWAPSSGMVPHIRQFHELSNLEFLAAPGGSWRFLAAPGFAPGCAPAYSWQLLVAPGAPWRLLAAPGCASGCAPGCSWRPLEAPGGSPLLSCSLWGVVQKHV